MVQERGEVQLAGDLLRLLPRQSRPDIDLSLSIIDILKKLKTECFGRLETDNIYLMKPMVKQI